MKKLIAHLQRLDGQGYGAYKAIKGSYELPQMRLVVDHVQGDPFAEPSHLRIFYSAHSAGWPSLQQADQVRALEDYIGRRLAEHQSHAALAHAGSGKSGHIHFMHHGQQVLKRTAVKRDVDGVIEIRLQAGLPANGRRILGQQAQQLLLEHIPHWVRTYATYKPTLHSTLTQHLNAVTDQVYLRNWLEQNQHVAFIAQGSRLPRASGIDDHPLPHGTPFNAPDHLTLSIDLPHRGATQGVCIEQGITLLVGGGFHGKSTLLSALAQGVYDHIPGDGRELVVTRSDAASICAEEGRAVSGIDIRPFINHLPTKRSTQNFVTSNASGSTSQAANIMEALQGGSRLLLMDEDRAATNLMMRDTCMQQLIAPHQEPITPLCEQISTLHEQHAISMVVVMGGSSAFFPAAHRVWQFDTFQLVDRTADAHQLVAPQTTRPTEVANLQAALKQQRGANPQILSPKKGKRAIAVKVPEPDLLNYGEVRIDLRHLEQRVDRGQTLAMGYMLAHFSQHLTMDDELLTALRACYQQMVEQGMDKLTPFPLGNLALPRFLDLLAALNRHRGLINHRMPSKP
ncbi:ABC-ATPase domain-containing protein [Magnetococcus sp. PR-3]|uniref:ABC-ATPase domain-containing protein n=1 Tax=Magnetococcus sp. PR-3 TaxID=3120355 RepID=UPI002FCE22C2